jgi:MoaA/NifB/PqqE/SkfB family radical SAM enzyme
MIRLSCPLLDAGLNLGHDRLQPCCPDSRYTRPEIPFAGGPFPLEAFLDLRRRTREAIRDGTSPCLRCPALVETADPPPEEGRFRAITLNHFRACNSRCVYCDFWRPEKGEIYRHRYSAFPILRDLAREGRIPPDATVAWGGGEPTILAEFEELMGLIDGLGIGNLVNTNALRFSPALADALRGRTRMQVSLDSGTPETFRKYKGLDRFATVVEHIGRYARANARNVQLKYIVAEGNAGDRDLLGFLDIATSLAVPRIAITPEGSEVRDGRIGEAALDGAARLWREALARGIEVSVAEEMYGPERMSRIRPPAPVARRGAAGLIRRLAGRLLGSP